MPPTILSNTPSWFFLQYHHRYSLQYTTRVSNLLTLPHWRITHASNAGTSPQHAAYITHASTSHKMARHPRQHATNANTPPTLACLPRHSCQQIQQAISQTPGYLVKLLKLLTLKFQEEIQQFLFLVFIFTAFTFQAFLSIFLEVWKTGKIKLFQRKLVCFIKKTAIFSKTNAQFFQKKLLPNISAVLAIIWQNSLLKINYLYYKF